MEAVAEPSSISVDVTVMRDWPELLPLLEANGLVGHVEEIGGRRELEIGFAPVLDTELRAAVRRVLSIWLAAHDTPLVVDESPRRFVLRPPSD